MKRVLWVAVLTAVPVLLHAALGPRYGGDQILRIGAVGSAPALDPRAPAGPTARLVLAMVHETLVRRGADGLAPGLAESWTPAAENREWTLALLPRLTFHDGKPVTGADAVRSIRRFLRSDSPAAAVFAESLDGGTPFRAGSTSELPGAEAPDASHVVLRFRVAVSEWSLLPLASPAAAVVSDRGTGGGPFVPTVSSAEELRFIAFAAHAGGRPFVDRVTLRLVPERRALAADLRLGRVDVALGSGPGLPHAAGVVLLVLDASRPPFDAADLRRDVAASIDRRALAERTLSAAEPWRMLLLHHSLKPGDSSVAPPRPRGGGRAIVLAVDRSLPPLASQRIVAHLDALGFVALVRPMEPSALRAASAEARLLLFEPEIDEPVLAVHELATMVQAAEVPLAALESDPAVRLAMALEWEQRLRSQGSLIPLARLSRSTEVAAHVFGVRADGATLRVEDAWTALR
jgi:extracellular solute-binding protein (family 5)